MDGVFCLAKDYLRARTVLRSLRLQVQKGDEWNAGMREDFLNMQMELDRLRSELTNLEITGLRADITSKQVQIRKLETALVDSACQMDSLCTQNADHARQKDGQEETTKERMEEVDSARLRFVQMERKHETAKA